MNVKGAIGLLIFCCVFPLVPAQEEAQDKKLKEYINVVNVELILRIIQNGQAQGGFKKEDFRLYENGKECRINGFFETRRQMARPALPPAASAKIRTPGRLFLLLFWYSPSSSDIQSKLNYFFDQLYQPGDRVILSSSRRYFEIMQPEQKEEVLAAFRQHWQELAKIHKMELQSTLSELNNTLLDASQSIGGLDPERPGTLTVVINALRSMENHYTAFIKEWSLLNNRLNIGQLEDFARNLEQVNSDKWVLVFYERDNRPLLNAEEVRRELLMASGGFFLEPISACADRIGIASQQAKTDTNLNAQIQSMRDRFAQAGAVFHLLQISPRLTRDLEAEISHSNSIIRMEPVFSNWDAVFQTISRSSGGRIVDMDQGLAVLDDLAKLEDISYILTYVPQERKAQHRKIELKIVNPELKNLQRHLTYGRRIEMQETPELRVNSIHTDLKSMRVQLESFYPILTTAGSVGHFSVSLAAEKTGSGPAAILYQQDIESSGQFEIPLSLHEAGDWTLWLRIVDLMSGKSLLEKRKIAVSPQDDTVSAPVVQTLPAQDELGGLLVKAAAYSDRLKKTALRFTCIESIVEQTLNRKSKPESPRYDRKIWQYDYQIVLDRGDLNENRLLVKKNQKKISPPLPAQLETFYESQYSFFLPVTMLAAERQPDYHYQIVGRDKINKKTMLRIRATAKNDTRQIPNGELWISEQDGSVWKVVLDARTVPGFRVRFANAGHRGIHLIMSDIHEYTQSYRGIQFPSATIITENHTYTQIRQNETVDSGIDTPSITYTTQAPPMQLEVLRVSYRYDQYRFFDIDSRMEIKDWNESD